MYRRNGSILEHEEVYFGQPPKYMKGIVDFIRCKLRREYPHIDEATDGEVMHFAAELWYPKI